MAPSKNATPPELHDISGLRAIPLVPEADNPGIYFLCHKGKVVYVGQSACVMARLGQHYQPANGQRKIFDAAFFVSVPEPKLIEAEDGYIALLKPKYNSSAAPRLKSRERRRPAPKSQDARDDRDTEYTIIGIRTICERLNRDRKFVYWLIDKGHLDAWKGGKRWETSEANLQKYIDSLQKGRK